MEPVRVFPAATWLGGDVSRVKQEARNVNASPSIHCIDCDLSNPKPALFDFDPAAELARSLRSVHELLHLESIEE